MKAVYLLLLVMAFTPLKTCGFSFVVKPAGTAKVTATPGDLIIYNSHLVITENTTLSFHVSLPYSQTPILNVEKIEVIGKGKNFQTSQQLYSYAEEDSASLNSRSQSSIDFGNVIWNTGSKKPGDDLVVQVQARLLDHTSVTSGTVFWLYFGMHYLNDAVWVIGKSVKVDLRSGPADVGVSLKIPDGHKPDMSNFKFEIDIYHLPGSKGFASSLTITLSAPSTLTSPVATAVGPSPAFDLSTNGGIMITFTEPLNVGQRAKISIKMTYGGSDKGKFVYGNIYGSFQYKTDPDGSGSCTNLQTMKKNESLQLAFKYYASSDTCDQSLSVGTVIQASSAMLPCCPARHTSPSAAYADKNWEVWTDETGARLADEYIQLDFEHKTTVRRIYTHGFAQKNQFTRSFHLSYSQNGAHWKYVTQMGKKKEFKANTNAVDIVYNVFPTPLTVWFLRIHIVKHSTAIAGTKLKLFGCEDTAATKPYEAYQRGFIAAVDLLILCNVHPDRMQAKPNCYRSLDAGLKWDPMHPSIVNVIGHDEATGKVYALGVTSADTPIYMEVISSQSVRVISEADWDTVKPGCSLPIVIPLYPVHGDPFYQLSGTSKTVGAIIYVASPEGLLKGDPTAMAMIASWAEFK